MPLLIIDIQISLNAGNIIKMSMAIMSFVAPGRRLNTEHDEQTYKDIWEIFKLLKKTYAMMNMFHKK